MKFKKYLNATYQPSLPTIFRKDSSTLKTPKGYTVLGLLAIDTGKKTADGKPIINYYQQNYEKESEAGGYGSVSFYSEVTSDGGNVHEPKTIAIKTFVTPEKTHNSLTLNNAIQASKNEAAILNLINIKPTINYQTIPAIIFRNKITTSEDEVNDTGDKTEYKIIMKAADGDLFDYVIDTEQSNIPAASIILQLVRSLYLLKKHNMYYTDLKLENIFYNKVERDIKIYLGDFGSISWFMDDTTKKAYVATFFHPECYNHEGYNREQAEKTMVFCLGLIMLLLKFRDSYTKKNLTAFFSSTYRLDKMVEVISYIREDINSLDDSDPHKKILLQMFPENIYGKYITIDEVHDAIFEQDFMRGILQQEKTRCETFQDEAPCKENSCKYNDDTCSYNEEYIRQEMNVLNPVGV